LSAYLRQNQQQAHGKSNRQCQPDDFHYNIPHLRKQTRAFKIITPCP
jgi:NAD-dependent SIR2 family protein deacetylase